MPLLLPPPDCAGLYASTFLSKPNLSTLTHIVGQLNQIQRYTEGLHEVENRRALKARAEEIRAIAFNLSELLIGMHNEEEDLSKRIRELEEELESRPK